MIDALRRSRDALSPRCRGPSSSPHFNDYDHLARVAEWSIGGEARNEHELDPLAHRQRRRSGAPPRPASSAWVEANAGTGKTKVLTDRVLRLLLAGSAAERILCLTFTKAAAAEMAQPLAERLGRWAMADDGALGEELATLIGAVPRRATQLQRAPAGCSRACSTRPAA